jgi:Zn-dependent peptidase ImmA (M78 family)/transcriptional regulator with XRE-family HTH domain
MQRQANPAMVILARESRGMTQIDLAERMGISQANLSKMESGLLGISESTLGKLSKALHYPESFYCREDQLFGIDTSILFHRKRESLLIGQLRKIHAEVNIRRMHISKLLHGSEMTPGRIFPRLDIEEFGGQPDEVARAVRAGWVLPRGPVENVTRAIENAGGIIIQCDFGTRLIDAISQWVGSNPPLFFVNTGVPGDRLRFSLAHELGHAIMHRTINQDVEMQADLFAASFLMPAQDIRDALIDVSLPKLALLKPYWKVSMTAMLKRACDLDIIGQQQRRYLWMRFSKAGYRMREPVELDIPVEEPRLIQQILDVHRGRLGYTDSDLSKLLDCHEDELHRLYGGQKTPSLRLVRRAAT